MTHLSQPLKISTEFHTTFKFVSWFLLALIFFTRLSVLSAEDNAGQPFFQEALRLEQEGAFTRAEGEFMKAIDLEPTNPDYHFELASLYASRYDSTNQRLDNLKSAEMLEKAARELKQTVMFRPDFLAAHYNLAIVYKRQRRLEEAREELRRVLELDPQSLNSRIQLGMIYEEQGFFEEAQDEYRKAKEIDFYNPEVQALLEELPQHEAIAHQKSLAESPQPGSYMNNNLGFENDQNSQQQSQGMAQALPYLAQVLAQQLMGRLSQKKDDE